VIDPRDDLYLVAALLADLDRVLNPLPLEERGDLAATPMIPPPLPPVTPRGAPPRSSGSSTPPRRLASAAAIAPTRITRTTPAETTVRAPVPPRRAPAPPMSAKTATRPPTASPAPATARQVSVPERGKPEPVVDPVPSVTKPAARVEPGRAVVAPRPAMPAPAPPAVRVRDPVPVVPQADAKRVAAPVRSVPPRRDMRMPTKRRTVQVVEAASEPHVARPRVQSRVTERRDRHVPSAPERRRASPRGPAALDPPIRAAMIADAPRLDVVRHVHLPATTKAPTLPRRRVAHIPEPVDDADVDPPHVDPFAHDDDVLGFELEVADGESITLAPTELRLRGGRMVVTSDAEAIARAERRLARFGRLRGRRL
jgi:hypothetical protein